MSVFLAIFLGIIQGLTEFLPISSSGHLMLFESIFGLTSGNMFFNVLLHFASLSAVVLVFWKDIVYMFKHPLSDQTKQIVIATIPTIIIALFVDACFDEFSLVAFLGFGFLISSIIIFVSSCSMKKQTLSQNYNFKSAFITGIVQGFAVLPGISRSGSTICAGLMQNIDKEQSAKFSFLMSVPVIFGGMVFEVYDGVKYGFGEVDALSSIIGFVFAFIIALLTIKIMMKIVKNSKWWGFSIYLLILSIIILLNQFLFAWF